MSFVDSANYSNMLTFKSGAKPSSPPVGKMSFVEENISRICKLIDPIYPEFISKSSFGNILGAEIRHDFGKKESGARELIEYLIKLWKEQPLKNSEITLALKNAAKDCENIILYELLDGDTKAIEEKDLFFKFLDLNWQTFLESREITEEFLIKWCDRNYITKHQCDRLKTMFEPTRTFRLISFLRLRPRWYVDLLDVLTEVNQTEYIEKCHPDFLKDERRWELSSTKHACVDDWYRKNTLAFQSSASGRGTCDSLSKVVDHRHNPNGKGDVSTTPVKNLAFKNPIVKTPSFDIQGKKSAAQPNCVSMSASNQSADHSISKVAGKMSFIKANAHRICKLIDPIYPQFISQHCFSYIISANTRHQLGCKESAAQELIDHLIGIWESFPSRDSEITMALKEAAQLCGNTILYDLLGDDKQLSQGKDLFFIFLDLNLETFLKSIEITEEFLTEWCVKKYISTDQCDELRKTPEPTRTYRLIALLKLRSQWYVDLLDVLTKVRQTGYIEICHPDFLKDPDDWNLPTTKHKCVNKWYDKNVNAFQSSPSVNGFTDSISKVGIPAEKPHINSSQQGISLVETLSFESSSNTKMLMEVDTSHNYGYSSTSITSNKLFSHQDYRRSSSSSSSNYNENNKAHGNESSEREILDDSAQRDELDLADLLGIDESFNVPSEAVPVVCSELIARPYQVELARDAIKGENVLIVAPTNSGKTHVAMLIAQNHLIDDRDDKRRVLFIVHRVNLVDQQYKQFITYFDAKEVVRLSGRTGCQVPLTRIVQKKKIVVLTVDRLKNALAMDTQDRFFLSKVSLIIFDECHNCMKEHPYNIVMDYYHKEIGSAKNSTRRPQIVGLTASPGTGQADNIEKAFNHLVTLCANLDCCTIAYKSEEEVREYMQNEGQSIDVKPIKAETRRTKWLDSRIQAVMDICEKALMKLLQEKKLSGEGASILLSIPSDRRGAMEYTNFVGNLKKLISCVDPNDGKLRTVVECFRNLLDVLNRTIHVYLLFRDKDAVQYMIDFLPKENVAPIHVVEDRLLKKIRGEIIKPAQQHEEDNPCLLALKEEIKKQLKEEPDSRVLVFVKERHFTNILAKVFQEDSELQHIPVDAIIGTQADSDNKGVSTQRWQMEVLNKFREGNKKVLFSTTVTEEGLDVVKCNLVIRYVHVTNEIAMVQSRGRARTKEARYVVIYHEKEDWIGKKEDVNQQRNDMMITAVERFQKYDKSEIFRIMKNVIEARNRGRLRRRGSMTKDNSEQSQITYHLLCKRCDELATNSTFIRRRNTLHFCIDSDVRNRCVLVNAPQNNCNDIEIIGKLKCKKCQVQKWGVQCRYMGKSIVVLKIKHFNLLPVMQDNTFGPCELCDQWSKVPFAVKELDMSDLFN